MHKISNATVYWGDDCHDSKSIRVDVWPIIPNPIDDQNWYGLSFFGTLAKKKRKYVEILISLDDLKTLVEEVETLKNKCEVIK